MMEVICSICHENVRVPVRFTCFSCKDQEGRSCNSVLRVCLFCAIGYLDLYTEQTLRAYERKCILCSQVCSPRSMNPHRAFEKDYLWMNLDPNVYSCFYSTEGCSFQGTQNELDRHLTKECEFRYEYCEDCFQPFPVKQQEFHRSNCLARTKCPSCSDFILLTDLHSHLITEHDMMYCIDCKDLIPIGSLDDHQLSCPCKRIKCRHCQRKIEQKRYWLHLRRHFDEIVQDTHFLSQEIQRKNTALQQLFQEILQFENKETTPPPQPNVLLC